MTLGATARDRLADVRELQPTTNGELGDRWGIDDGSEIAGYLRTELDEYTYRDENGKIRARVDAPTDTDPADADSEQRDAESRERDATPTARETDPDADVSPSASDGAPAPATETAPVDSIADEATDDVTDTNPSDNPVFGSVDPDADADAGLAADDSVELPCGCESYEPTEAPERPFAVTCSTCGTSYRVTPDGDESENDDDRVELPCGCESFDPGEAPEPPFKMTCTDCGKPYKVTA